jgi:hypothetical protein
MYTVAMSIKLPLHEMTIKEKLAVMESLWEDLSRSPDSIESPEWHKEILEHRRERVAEKTARFVDWEVAKAEIRKKIR